MSTTRRDFLRQGLIAATSLSVAQPFQALLAQPSAAARIGSGFGPLVPVADRTTGLPLLKLPDGFEYLSFGWQGDPMGDGLPTPSSHDGMAVVSAHGDTLTLVRNHEVVSDRGAIDTQPHCYDPAAGGGTTTLRFDTRRGEFTDARVSLSGTLANCCGGPTPWGSWLSGEEVIFDAAQQVTDARTGESRAARLQRDHGYMFEVRGEGGSDAVALKGLGRFAHEAAAVDARTGIVYLTEDRHPEAGFYRFIPDQPGQLARGGRLQMLRVPARTQMIIEVDPTRRYDTEWVDIEEPDRAHHQERDGAGVLMQGLLQMATSFRRLEGCWSANDEIYFTSTSGGDAGLGQVFAYDPRSETLRLIFESPGAEVLDYPDNLTASPRGGLLLCEDGGRVGQYLAGLSLDGQLFRFAQNDMVLAGGPNDLSGDFRGSEWCGACFSPDGQWLFVNIQTPGVTFAITGPWREGLL